MSSTQPVQLYPTSSMFRIGCKRGRMGEHNVDSVALPKGGDSLSDLVEKICVLADRLYISFSKSPVATVFSHVLSSPLQKEAIFSLCGDEDFQQQYQAMCVRAQKAKDAYDRSMNKEREHFEENVKKLCRLALEQGDEEAFRMLKVTFDAFVAPLKEAHEEVSASLTKMTRRRLNVKILEKCRFEPLFQWTRALAKGVSHICRAGGRGKRVRRENGNSASIDIVAQCRRMLERLLFYLLKSVDQCVDFNDFSAEQLTPSEIAYVERLFTIAQSIFDQKDCISEECRKEIVRTFPLREVVGRSETISGNRSEAAAVFILFLWKNRIFGEW